LTFYSTQKRLSQKAIIKRLWEPVKNIGYTIEKVRCSKVEATYPALSKKYKSIKSMLINHQIKVNLKYDDDDENSST
jgi:hypothetical protein